MSPARTFWEQIYRRFNPQEPARRQEWRVNRPYSPRDKIRRSMHGLSDGPKRHIIIGTQGTGLSTELQAIAAEHSNERMVVFLDVYRYFNETLNDPAALQYVAPWEVLFLLGLAVYRAARDDILGHDWAEEHLNPFQRAVAELGRESSMQPKPVIDVPTLASAIAVGVGGPIGGLAGAGLKMLGAVTKSARWSFEIGKRDRAMIPDQDERISSLRSAVSLLIGTIQSAYLPLLIVVDGLDRIQEKTTTERLFLESNLLSSLPCETVVDGPLVFRSDGLAPKLLGFELRVLTNIQVFDPHELTDHWPTTTLGPAPHELGLATLREVYNVRVRDIEPDSGDTRGIPEPLLDRLAYYSGGRLRDFIRLVRLVAAECVERDLAVADQDVVDACIRERRLVMEMGLYREDIDLLTQVIEDPARLPAGDQVSHLLDTGHLLPYPNESTWYFPHPLLLINQIRLRQAKTTG